MTDPRFEAAPMKTAQIEAIATQVRAHLEIDVPWLPVPEILEHYLPLLIDGYAYDVRDVGEMGNRHGYFDPFEKLLVLRADVYEGLCKGRGRDRFTATHELGHLLLHGAGLNRLKPGRVLPLYRDPEWQADAFAAAILMPEPMVLECNSIAQVASEFGVSMAAASHRVRKLKHLGFK